MKGAVKKKKTNKLSGFFIQLFFLFLLRMSLVSKH